MPLPLPQVEGITHRDVTVRGIRLHVAEGGPADAPPILLLHGWPQHWWMWRDILPELARVHRVIAPDLRGLGWSDAPKRGYVKQELADDNIALLDALGLDRVDLLAHDWGAFTGFLVCLTAPERINRFIGCSIPHIWPPAERPSLRRLAQLWYQVALATPGLGQGLMRQGEFTRRVLTAARHNGRYTDFELAQFVDVLKQPDHALAAAQYYRSFLLHELKPIASGGFHDRILTTPSLLLWGRKDPILQGASDSEHRAFAPNLEIEWVPETGHFLPEERPALVVERARSFFSD
ncbi:alpha/beta fold hydrolase [Conexibacter sp. JD483]|uniref:alpha/beta fold hydrolase n=1 Tax=unclassified Conexibacter TaxID=2627773 RepID=UPI00271C843B|nr:MULTISPECIES: alpha/beta fold hydrolase [unclassified Conexibacter]MDO8187147.1 alpha/beta fold hydrolase [Conexibacter sp. CPCC 205706]MDO8200323.1 alpha/beta fold hydrolase [Conexibacter sp. CPCC 205762]MDR9368881.1 alpha/beta fold hydrolase [Conexibacter sp. JD483]